MSKDRDILFVRRNSMQCVFDTGDCTVQMGGKLYKFILDDA